MASISTPLVTKRSDLLARLAHTPSVDLIVIGGGATGLGIAVDAASRGASVVLLEAHDFAKGTSSRATKLVHGGVRYLAQGNLSLVREALQERAILLKNAPHLASALGFIMPSYACWEKPFYGLGLKTYDLLAGRQGLGATRFLSSRQTQQQLPGVKPQGLKGGVMYWDGQFDDARLALALARTAAVQSALVLNYCEVQDLIYDQNKVAGVVAKDTETDTLFTVRAPCVVNATGVWVDRLRIKDAQHHNQNVKPLVTPSQGAHVVVEAHFLPSKHALLVPKTADGRVLFAVPWHGKLILGTTDTPNQALNYEPQALKSEVDFILHEAAKYLAQAPTHKDIKSVWVGLRPLVNATALSQTTKQLSREHTILSSPSGLVTVTGGKWTTYRHMAEEVVDYCIQHGHLQLSLTTQTKQLPVVGAPTTAPDAASLWASYGTEADYVQSLPGAENELLPGLNEAMVRFAVQHEYARTVEDILARRSRWLFLDAQLAAQAADDVGKILQSLGVTHPQTDAFKRLCAQYTYL